MPGRPRHADILTPREWQVLELVREGLTNAEIADRLGISLDGAKYHVSEIISKLGVGNRREAAVWRPEHRLPWRLPGVGLLRRGLSSVVGRLATPFVFGLAACSLAVLAAGVLLMALRSNAAPEDSAALGKLVYVDGGDLWTKQLPDGQPQRLTTDGNNLQPQWSPSGQWILYQKPQPGIVGPQWWVMQADGSDNHQLIDARVLRWAPHSDTLAYVSADTYLYLEEADGSNHRLLVDARVVDQTIDWYIEWSPDGAWLAVTTSKRGFGFPAAYVGLWAVRADGSDSRELVSMQPAQNGLVVAGWTPDSKWVIYSPDPSFSASYVADGLQWQAVPLDGSQPPRGVFVPAISGSIDLTQEVLRYDDYVDFSPDGGSIVAVRGGGRNAFGKKTIAVVDIGGGFVSRDLTPPEVGAGSPAWSPDGATIAYTVGPQSGVGNPWDVVQRRIWLMRPDGSNKRRLFPDEFAQDTPQWSRDGQYILYVRPVRNDSEQDKATPTNAEVFPKDPAHASLWLVKLSDGSQHEVLADLPFYLNDVPRNIGYYGHFDWSKVFDWWRGS